MEKIRIKPKAVPNSSFEINKQKIIVTPYIGLSDRIVLATSYIDALFSTDNMVENYLVAEDALAIAVIDICTNVEISSSDDVDINYLIGSGLWEKVKSHIKNYSVLRRDIDRIVALVQAQNSTAGVLKEFLNKVTEVLEDVDISKEGIDNLVSQFQEQTAKLSETLGGEEKEAS